MKRKFLVSIILFCVCFFAGNNVISQSKESSLHTLKHIVIITFKKDASADSIQALDNIYKGLSKSNFVKDFEMGINVGGRDTGVVKHIYVTSFASKDNMKSYQKIPLYSSLFKISLPISEDVSVVDYWVEK